MAITKKPKAKVEPQGVDVDALIRKGGSVAGETSSVVLEPDKVSSVILRIPAGVMDRVDRAVQARRIKTPRHTWLMEAILEKLDRESN